MVFINLGTALIMSNIHVKYDPVVQAICYWFQNSVIAFNFCPFAILAFKADAIYC